MFSARTRIGAAPNELALAQARRRASGLPIWDLTISNPTCVGLPDLSAELGQALAGAEFRYDPEPLGLRSARELIAAELGRAGRKTSADQVALAASTSEAYSLLFRLLCEPGDEILVPAPSYPLLDHLARYDGVEVRRYVLLHDGAWHIDWQSVASAISPRTRAFVAVSPNNPTGNLLRDEEEAKVRDELGLPLIIDEVFSRYRFGPSPIRAVDAGEVGSARGLTFALDGLSKACAMPQMKLAWMSVRGDRALVAEAMERLEHLADAYLSASTVTQSVLARLLELGSRARSALSGRLQANLHVLSRLLRGTSLTLLEPEAGWYAVVRLPSIREEEAWVVQLLEQAGVLVHPGFFYDFPTEPHAVLSLIVAPVQFEQAVQRLVAFVEQAAS